MIEWSEVLDEDLEEIKRRIERKRNVYRSPDGIRELCSLIESANVFDGTDPKDEAESACRNFALSVMEGLDLVSRDTLPLIVEFMLSLPVGRLKQEE